MKSLAAEIFKTINKLNPSFMKEIFTTKILEYEQTVSCNGP